METDGSPSDSMFVELKGQSTTTKAIKTFVTCNKSNIYLCPPANPVSAANDISHTQNTSSKNKDLQNIFIFETYLAPPSRTGQVLKVLSGNIKRFSL